jgi:hypothetical protein
VTGGVGGTGEGSVGGEDAIDTKEEVSIKFEAVYIKDEIPETSTFPPITTEHEVRLLGVSEVEGGVVCEVVADVLCEVVTAVVWEVVAYQRFR